VLRKLYPERAFVEINPQDAQRLGVTQNQWVTVFSQRGRMGAMAFLTHNVPVGQVFVPMHYEETNRLTDAVFDPYSRQPSYKACAVNILPGRSA
jgi:assimilatory nitrate reductase catalytic subunit